MLPEKLAAWVDANHVPVSAMIELTARCNWRCKHCFVIEDPRIHETEMSTDEVFALVDDLHDLGCFFITFTGGEVFLRPDFLDIVAHAAGKAMAVTIYTNASRVDAAKAQRMADLGVVEVHVSVLGHTAQTHERITLQPRSHDKCWAGINHMRDAGLNVIVKTPVTTDNQDELEELVKHARDQELPHIYSTILFPRFPGDTSIEALRVDDEQIARVSLLAEGARLDMGGGPNTVQRRTSSEDGKRAACRAGVTSVNVCADGSIRPCQAFPGAAGNVRRERFKDVWARSRLFERLRGARHNDTYSAPGGAEIHAFACPVLAAHETGDGTAVSDEATRFNRVMSLSLGAPARQTPTDAGTAGGGCGSERTTRIGGACR